MTHKMERIIAVALACGLYLSGCTGGEDAEVSYDSSEKETQKTSEESSRTRPTKMSEQEAAQTYCLADEMPSLTPEEEAKVDEIVPPEVWGSWYVEDEVPRRADGSASFPGIISRQLRKPLNEITYGELWRFNNYGQILSIYVSPEEEGNGLSPALAELKSITRFSMAILGESTDTSLLASIYWMEELAVYGNNFPHDSAAFPWEVVTQLPNLKVLRVRYLDLQTVPDIFDAMPQLEELDLSRCDIHYLPDSVYRLPNLRVLKLLANKNFSMLDERIGWLTTLEELDLRSTNLETLPESLANLTNLHTISISRVSASPQEDDALQEEAYQLLGKEYTSSTMQFLEEEFGITTWEEYDQFVEDINRN